MHKYLNTETAEAVQEKISGYIKTNVSELTARTSYRDSSNFDITDSKDEDKTDLTLSITKDLSDEMNTDLEKWKFSLSDAERLEIVKEYPRKRPESTFVFSYSSNGRK